jgi:hypothetical protein
MSDADAPNQGLKPPRRWSSVATVVLLLLVAATLLYFPIREARQAANRSACKNHLHQIGLALHAYHEEYGSFPPAYTVDADGRRMHSWRVLILPFLGQDDLYSQYRFDEPWDGPHNRELVARMPEVFGCPGQDDAHTGRTQYLAVVGPETVWPEQYAGAVRDVFDGTSNTIQLVEWAESDVNWLEPRDVSYREARRSPLRVTHPPGSDEGIQHALFADGSVRAISLHIEPRTYRQLLTARSGALFPGVDWPVDLPVGQFEFGEAVSSDQLERTDVIPYRSGRISDGRNYVNCATFQLAWDDFRTVVGGDAVRLDGDPPLAAAMNAESFPRSALAADSFVARGGLMRDGILDQILAEMAQKFPNADRELLASRPSDDAVVMYAFLLKVLPFREEFDRLGEPIAFKTGDGDEQTVASFGLSDVPIGGLREHAVREQVTILDYVNNDDFILRIDAGNTHDGIILAKVAPGPTLAATLDRVQERIRQPHSSHNRRECETGEPLAIPVLTLNVRRDYGEVLGHHILNPELTGLWIDRAAEVIRFRLDETGAHLEAEAEIVGENGHSEPVPVPGPRRFVFDRPFLLLLQERDAPTPYFAAWIANTELMDRVSAP